MGFSAVPGRSGVGSPSTDTIQYKVVLPVYNCLNNLSKNSVSRSRWCEWEYIRTYDKHLLVGHREDREHGNVQTFELVANHLTKVMEERHCKGFERCDVPNMRA